MNKKPLNLFSTKKLSNDKIASIKTSVHKKYKAIYKDNK